MRHLTIFLILLVLILGGTVWVVERNAAKQRLELQLAKQNLRAARDSIRISIDNKGDTQFNKLTFITDKLSDLEKMNANLAAEVAATKGKVIALQTSNIKIVTDTFWAKTTEDTVNKVVHFNADTAYDALNVRFLEGDVYLDSMKTRITNDAIFFTATTGLDKQPNGDYEIFLRSNYPGLHVVGLDGAYIPKNQLIPKTKKKRWQYGLQVGYSPIVYDFTKHKLGFENQITAGIGINYQF